MCNRMTAPLHVFAGLRGIPLAVFPILRFVPYAIHSAYLGLACMSIRVAGFLEGILAYGIRLQVSVQLECRYPF